MEYIFLFNILIELNCSTTGRQEHISGTTHIIAQTLTALG
jgi:hypothetical protein